MSTQLLIDPADELTRRLLGGASGVAAGTCGAGAMLAIIR